MLELAIVLVALYLVSVAVSWGLIKLIFDDIPARYSLIPVLNVILPFLDLERGLTSRRTGIQSPTTPQQELLREQARRNTWLRGPWGTP